MLDKRYVAGMGLYEHVNKPRWCVEMAYGGREDRIRLRRGFFCSFGQRPGFSGAIFQEILSISGRDIGVWVAPKNRVLKFKMATELRNLAERPGMEWKLKKY